MTTSASGDADGLGTGSHPPTRLVHISTVVHNIKIAWMGTASRRMSEKNDRLLHRWARRPQILISFRARAWPRAPQPAIDAGK